MIEHSAGTPPAQPTRMLRLAPVLALVALVGACVQDSSLETANRRPIVGGQAEGGFPAVGLLRAGTGLCSGTVVAPRIVVSAKHCIKASTTPEQVTFSTGSTGETPAGTAVRFFYTGAFAPANTVPADDFLVIVLDRDPGVGRIVVSRTGIDGREGASVELIGYGLTSSAGTDAGRKRSGSSTIYQVAGTTFQTAASGANATVCGGDSGGPVLLDQRLVGVVSGSTDNCRGRSFITRIDPYTALMREAAEYVRTGQAGDGRTDPQRRDPRDRDAQRQRRRPSAQGDDSCAWANDGVCDEPEICDAGTDATDCGSGEDPEGAPDPDACYCDDLCVDNGDCCADCSDTGDACDCDTTWDCDQDEFAGGDCACDPECGGGGDAQCYCDDVCDENGDCCADCAGGESAQCYCDDVCDENGDCCEGCGDTDGAQCYCDDLCADNGDCCDDCGDLGDAQCYCDDVCADNGDCCADCADDGAGDVECDAWGGRCACDDGSPVCCDDYAYYCESADDVGTGECYCDDLCTDNGDCCDGCWVYGDDWI